MPGSSAVPLIVCVFPHPVAFGERHKQNSGVKTNITHPIREDSRVVAIQNIRQQRLSSPLVHILLASVMPKDAIKYESAVLVAFGTRWKEPSFDESPGDIVLLGVECQDAVVDDLDDVAQVRLRCD